jgi:outer membrane protein OmpA-like peptidoglycan-associated protein
MLSQKRTVRSRRAASRLRLQRWLPCVAVLLFAGVCPPALAESEPAESERPEPTLPPLQVTLDKNLVDLERHSLEVRMSRKAGRVEIKVYADSGVTLAEESHNFDGRPANSPLRVTWSPASDEAVAKIEVYAYDAFGYFKGIAIIPWSLEIPHEEVLFETNSAVIGSSEEPKLAASMQLIVKAFEEHKDLGPIRLFIAGHTDTRGEAAHNLDLSRRRARAIGQWFKQRGLALGVAYEGFGEYALKVKTADEVDEPRNRRVDYVLSIDAPRLKSSGAPAAWKQP